MTGTTLRKIYGTLEQLEKVAALESEEKSQEGFILAPHAKNYLKSVNSTDLKEKPSYGQLKVVFWEFYTMAIEAQKKEVVVTDELKEVFRNSLLWLIDEGKYNPYMGLFFAGSKGTSKTFIMKALMRTAHYFKLKKAFRFSEAPVIFDNCQYDKNFNMNQYSIGNLMIDDVGFSEPTIQSFGNTMRPIETILRNRYNRFLNEGILTHVTTNLSLDRLEVHFDERVLDRFNEMFNIILFSGESFRKK